jgi:hypothetical protein
MIRLDTAQTQELPGYFREPVYRVLDGNVLFFRAVLAMYTLTAEMA